MIRNQDELAQAHATVLIEIAKARCKPGFLRALSESSVVAEHKKAWLGIEEKEDA